ncbi:MAG: Holliday junction resolvase RuvX [Gemmatimonadetes bacterium]|nr:Holliday junction resolvase RuvX [Gemmatimonadota bacterium]
MEIPANGRLLAIDWGEKRIGLALCNPEQTLAHPLGTITRRQGKRFPLNQLKTYLDENEPVGVVVGLPLEASGEMGPNAERAREAGESVRSKTGLPVVYWDERMTTARALNAVHELGGSTRHRRGDVDQLAATVLLQTYLDGRRA